MQQDWREWSFLETLFANARYCEATLFDAPPDLRVPGVGSAVAGWRGWRPWMGLIIQEEPIGKVIDDPAHPDRDTTS